jgi:enamine deaminase RidA (YjgF/YER057c/UK114 family)
MTNGPILSNPATLAQPLGAYSHVSRAGNTVYVAGQVGMLPNGEMAGDDVASQTRQTYLNLRAALESQGLGLSNVAKFTTYLVDADAVSQFYEARNALFPELFPDGNYPPNTLLVIDRLVFPEIKIEIEAVAYAAGTEG